MMASANSCPHGLPQRALLWLGLVTTTHLAWAAPSDGPANAILRVAKDKTAEYASIQSAIDAAPAGATIRVGPGVYEENLKLRQPLVLEGAGWSQTTIAAPRLETGLAVEQAARDLEQRLSAAQTEQERRTIAEEFLEQHAPPPLWVRDARGVQVRRIEDHRVRCDPRRALPGRIAGGRLPSHAPHDRLCDPRLTAGRPANCRRIGRRDTPLVGRRGLGDGNHRRRARRGSGLSGDYRRLRRAELPLRRDRHHGPKPGDDRALSHFGSRLARHPLRRQFADDRWQPDLRPCALRHLCVRQDGRHRQAERLLEERDGRDVLLVCQPRHSQPRTRLRATNGRRWPSSMAPSPASIRTFSSAIPRPSSAVARVASKPRPAPSRTLRSARTCSGRTRLTCSVPIPRRRDNPMRERPSRWIATREA